MPHIKKIKNYWSHFENWGHQPQIFDNFFKNFVHIFKTGVSPKFLKIFWKIFKTFGHI
jgi:hypothetical protein